jgi:hypothetical protein
MFEAKRCKEELTRIYSNQIAWARTPRERTVLRWLLDGLEEDLEVICNGIERDVRIYVRGCR